MTLSGMVVALSQDLDERPPVEFTGRRLQALFVCEGWHEPATCLIHAGFVEEAVLARQRIHNGGSHDITYTVTCASRARDEPRIDPQPSSRLRACRLVLRSRACVEEGCTVNGESDAAFLS